MRRAQDLPPSLVFGVLLLVLGAIGVLASAWRDGPVSSASGSLPPPGRAAREAPAAPLPSAVPPRASEAGTAELSLDDVRAGATVPDGPFLLEAGEGELGQVITEGLEESGTRIDDLEISLTDAGSLVFDGVLADQDVSIAGVIDLRVVDGRLDPEVTEATLGGVPLPGFARGYVDDLVGEATSFGDELARQGVVLEEVRADDGRLWVTGSG